jgi:hypothetical protein
MTPPKFSSEAKEAKWLHSHHELVDDALSRSHQEGEDEAGNGDETDALASVA